MGKSSHVCLMLKVAALARKIQSDPAVAEDAPSRLKIYQDTYALTHKWMDLVEAELTKERLRIEPEEAAGGRLNRKGALPWLLAKIGTMIFKALRSRRGGAGDAAATELFVETFNILKLFLEDAKGEIDRLERLLGRPSAESSRDGRKNDAQRMSKPFGASPSLKSASSSRRSRRIKHHGDIMVHGSDNTSPDRDFRPVVPPAQPQAPFEHLAPPPEPDATQPPAQRPEDPRLYAPRGEGILDQSPSKFNDRQQEIAPEITGTKLEEASDSGSSHMPSQAVISTDGGRVVNQSPRSVHSEIVSPARLDRSRIEGQSRASNNVPSILPSSQSQQDPIVTLEIHRNDRKMQRDRTARSDASSAAPTATATTFRLAAKKAMAQSEVKTATQRSQAGSNLQHVTHAPVSEPFVAHTRRDVQNAPERHSIRSGKATEIVDQEPDGLQAAAKSSLATFDPMKSLGENRDTAKKGGPSMSSLRNFPVTSSLEPTRASNPSERGAQSIHASEANTTPREPAPSSHATSHRAKSIRSGVKRSENARHPANSQAVAVNAQTAQSAAPSHQRSGSQASHAPSARSQGHSRAPKKTSEARNATVVPRNSQSGTQESAAPSTIHGSHASGSRAKTPPLAASSAVHSTASNATKTSRASSHRSASTGQRQPVASISASTVHPISQTSSRAEPAANLTAKLTTDNLAHVTPQTSSFTRSSASSDESRAHTSGSRVKPSTTESGTERGQVAGSKGGQSESGVSEIDMGFVRPKRPLKCHHPDDDEDNPKPESCDSVADTDELEDLQ